MDYNLISLFFYITYILLSSPDQSNSIFTDDQSTQTCDLIQSIKENTLKISKILIDQQKKKEENEKKIFDNYKQILNSDKPNLGFFIFFLDKAKIEDRYVRRILSNLYLNHQCVDFIEKGMSIEDLQRTLVFATINKDYTLVKSFLDAGLNTDFSYILEDDFGDDEEQTFLKIVISQSSREIFKLVFSNNKNFIKCSDLEDYLDVTIQHDNVKNFLLLLKDFKPQGYIKGFLNCIIQEKAEKIIKALLDAKEGPENNEIEYFELALLHKHEDLISKLIKNFSESHFYLFHFFRMSIEQNNQYTIERLIDKITSKENKAFFVNLSFIYNNKNVTNLLVEKWVKGSECKKDALKNAIHEKSNFGIEKLLNKITLEEDKEEYLKLVLNYENSNEFIPILIQKCTNNTYEIKKFFRISIENNNNNALKELLPKIKENISGDNLIDYFKIAIEYSTEESFNLLFNELNFKTIEPSLNKINFIRAINRCELATIRDYIKQRISLNFLELFELNPLDFAFLSHYKKNMDQSSLNVLSLLIDSGAKSKNIKRLIPREVLGYYVCKGNFKALKKLVEAVKDPEKILKKSNANGEFIMQQAANSMNLHIIKFLLDYIKFDYVYKDMILMFESAIKKNCNEILEFLLNNLKTKNNDIWHYFAFAIKKEANKKITSLLFSKLNMSDKKLCISEALCSLEFIKDRMQYKKTIIDLLKKGIKLLDKTSDLARSFFMLCLKGGSKHDKELIKLLLELGLNLNFIVNNCIAHESHTSSTKFLSFSPNVDDMCTQIYTPLQFICLNKRYKSDEKVDIVKLILNQEKDIYGLKKALKLAIVERNIELIELILEKINCKNQYQKKCLYANAINFYLDKVDEFLHKKCKECDRCSNCIEINEIERCIHCQMIPSCPTCEKWKRCQKCIAKNGEYYRVKGNYIASEDCKADENYEKNQKYISNKPWMNLRKFLAQESLDNIYFLISENLIKKNNKKFDNQYLNEIVNLAIDQADPWILELLIKKKILKFDEVPTYIENAIKKYEKVVLERFKLSDENFTVENLMKQAKLENSKTIELLKILGFKISDDYNSEQYNLLELCLKGYNLKRFKKSLLTDKEIMVIKTLLKSNPKSIECKTDYINYLLRLSIEQDDDVMFGIICEDNQHTYLNMNFSCLSNISKKFKLIPYILHCNSLKILKYLNKKRIKITQGDLCSLNLTPLGKGFTLVEYLFFDNIHWNRKITNFVLKYMDLDALGKLGKLDKLEYWFDQNDNPWDHSENLTENLRENLFEKFYLARLKNNNYFNASLEVLVYVQQAEMIVFRIAIALLEGKSFSEKLKKAGLKLEAKLANEKIDELDEHQRSNYNFDAADLLFQVLFNRRILEN